MSSALFAYYLGPTKASIRMKVARLMEIQSRDMMNRGMSLVLAACIETVVIVAQVSIDLASDS